MERGDGEICHRDKVDIYLKQKEKVEDKISNLLAPPDEARTDNDSSNKQR